MGTVRDITEARCDAWAKSGQKLRAAVAWRIHEGKGEALSMLTGVPMPALEGFVRTGRISQHNRELLDVAK